MPLSEKTSKAMGKGEPPKGRCLSQVWRLDHTVCATTKRPLQPTLECLPGTSVQIGRAETSRSIVTCRPGRRKQTAVLSWLQPLLTQAQVSTPERLGLNSSRIWWAREPGKCSSWLPGLAIGAWRAAGGRPPTALTDLQAAGD